MKMINRASIYFFLSLFWITIVSCYYNSENNNLLSSGQTEKDLPGKAVYKQYCLTCHQINGTGVPGMIPPIGQGSWVGKDPAELIKLELKGLTGVIEVNGETFKNVMPSQAKLTDEEIAYVLTYVRSNFGNNYPPISINMVKKIRAGQ
jgi:mono/diheme cytochrome c family protein